MIFADNQSHGCRLRATGQRVLRRSWIDRSLCTGLVLQCWLLVRLHKYHSSRHASPPRIITGRSSKNWPPFWSWLAATAIDARAIHGSSRSATVHPSAFVTNGPRLVVVATGHSGLTQRISAVYAIWWWWWWWQFTAAKIALVLLSGSSLILFSTLRAPAAVYTTIFLYRPRVADFSRNELIAGSSRSW